jgi:YbbR domain-containing protein
VLGQNIRTFNGTVPVDAIRPPAGATLLSDLAPVTTIRYRAPLDVGVVSPDSFSATVDLSRVEAKAGGEPVDVPVTLVALDRRIQIVDYQPRSLEVQLDPVAQNQLPVTVDLGTVPEGLNVGPPQTEPSSVNVTGASSRVASIRSVVARVTIDASALNIDREVDLVAVDGDGNQVRNVEIDPSRVRVRVAVARQLANRTLPVVAQIIGDLAPGYRITSVTVEPLVVTVSGEESTVTLLQSAMTAPIDVTGRTSDLEAMIGFALPAGVSVSGSDQVRVVLTISEDRGSQTFRAGIQLTGTQIGLTYAIAAQSVDVTLGGALADLDRLDAATLLATGDVSGLGAGSHAVTLTLQPPDGLEVVAMSPTEVLVDVTPPPSPSPSPSPSGSPIPTATP